MRSRCIPGPVLRCAILLCGFLQAAAPSHAQDAFSRVSASVGMVHNVNRTDFHTFWAAGTGGELALSTPFHLGEVELGLALHRYEMLREEVPRFDALLTTLGWRIDVSPWEAASWYNGIEVGNYWMSFDEETFSGVRNESELMLGLYTRIELRCSSLIHLYVAGRTMRIYTEPRLPLTYVSGGLRLTLDSPNWLATILR